MSTDTSKKENNEEKENKEKKEKKENNQWVQYVQFFREMNPELDHKQALKEAKESYQMLKKIYSENGSFSNMDLILPESLKQTKLEKEPSKSNNSEKDSSLNTNLNENESKEV